MRTWIEKDCGPKFYDQGRFVSCKNHPLWPYYPYKLVTWNWHWYRDCEKWRVGMIFARTKSCTGNIWELLEKKVGVMHTVSVINRVIASVGLKEE
jgi:hypothetical protein